MPLFSARYNAQLSSPKRYYKLSALRRNHQTQRKTKMPRVEGLLELFVMCVAQVTMNEKESLLLSHYTIGLGSHFHSVHTCYQPNVTHDL